MVIDEIAEDARGIPEEGQRQYEKIWISDGVKHRVDTGAISSHSQLNVVFHGCLDLIVRRLFCNVVNTSHSS